ncbi:hypothetical protein LTR56_001687 [Elasticomyces elasticus]|nr:hypothetical protein LTR56_001687 [Elasticomyces elasticus]KAK3667262.1 hypothetical protein LTR22_001778 [Elasticomyces elasticus]KAK4932660.1 hypothetical protein LTR49_001084 [Elasticomyces elasticus]KAK5769681.1 hypothetical protein LTS12_000131 [Elasticomyces elasticus]
MGPPRKADADPSPGWQLVERKKSRNNRLRDAPPLATKAVSVPIFHSEYSHLRCPPNTPAPTNHSYRTASHVPSVSDLHALRHFVTYLAAMKEIGDANLHSFAKYIHPLTLLRVSHEGVELPNDAQGTGEYAVVRSKLGLVARLRMTADVLDLTGIPITMIVLADGTTIPLKDWLSGLPEPAVNLPTGVEGFQLQYKWWCERGQFCDFPTLPENIQHTLLLHMVGEVCEVTVRPDLDSRHGRKQGYWLLRRFPRVEDGLALGRYDGPKQLPWWEMHLERSILGLNKSSRIQAQKIIRQHTTKYFRSLPVFRDIFEVPKIAPTLRLDFLNRIQLTFSDTEYAVFFGAELPFVPRRSVGPPVATGLGKLLGIRYLEISFQSTMKRDTCNSWPHDAHHPRDCVDGDPGSEDVDRGGFPCRKAIVDYLLSFAYKYIKKIPNVNLTGCIKESTRDRWMSILHTNESHFPGFDERLSAHIKQIKNMLAASCPPPCYCPVPCEYLDFAEAWWAARINFRKFNVQEKNDWRDEQAIERAIKGYHFDHGDSQPPVEFVGARRYHRTQANRSRNMQHRREVR